MKSVFEDPPVRGSRGLELAGAPLEWKTKMRQPDADALCEFDANYITISAG